VDFYTEEHPSITWKVDEPIADLSERLAWSVAVRRREPWELDTFLRMLKEYGSCTVVLEDPKGEVIYYPCHLSMHELAISTAA
jgi:hypothetical protein